MKKLFFVTVQVPVVAHTVADAKNMVLAALQSVDAREDENGVPIEPEDRAHVKHVITND